ncbi:MAG TPA: permease [Haliea salexigens]|uniref:Permease n=1 Tax=Haliea salexigens TaxID=287487 RepID=A0A3C1KMG4_9GAMM|nr:permease [Haliea sp.]HAN27791.1 permease [Haliea salexigens]|tara:strand:+ start:712 stop:1941 length:1230 start_codon:yes stop_codon:yes gene_type:complete
MQDFLQAWNAAATTSLGFFWMALWAFILGYLISSLIQVLVTRERMQKAMGKDGPRSVLLGTFFGFISSSCSFSALSTTRAIFNKGAGLAPSMAFMLASTNLVIELGMVIAIFLGWQFVVGEYVGGIILILVSWLLIRITRPRRLEAQARKHQADTDEEDSEGDISWQKKLVSLQSWQNIGQTYVMEWQMVWRDVLIGFTVAGMISAMVPDSFFQAMFIGSGGENAANPGFLAVLAQTLVGPLAAFFTFIGSMGNIPLAAVLFGQGVTFAGVMAFIFSDLVVLPVLRINAGYYGWKMALYLLGLMLVAIVIAALSMHYALAALGMLPDFSAVTAPGEREYFKLNYQLVMNAIMFTVNLALVWLWYKAREKSHGHDHRHDHGGSSLTDKVLSALAAVSVVWLSGGLIAGLF